MERLTYRSPVLHNEVSYGACEGVECCCDCENCKIGAIISKLCAYEDTKVTPEEIAEVQVAMDPIPFGRFHDIMEAERGGRLVVLPCRVTDTVYMIEAIFEKGKKKKRNKPSGERVVSAQIDHVTIGGTTGKTVFDLCTETGNWYYSMDPEQFYLTREVAEAALKGWEG